MSVRAAQKSGELFVLVRQSEEQVLNLGLRRGRRDLAQVIRTLTKRLRCSGLLNIHY